MSQRLQITLDHVEDLARGAAVLGTGGGGDPYIGALMLKQALQDGCQVELLDIETVRDEACLIPFALMGAPTVMIEKIPSDKEFIAALRSMEHHLRKQAEGVMCAEIGGLNSLLPLVLGARARLPVIDGDGMGRAFPQLQMTTYHIFGIPASPMVMADEYSRTVVDSERSEEVERLGRNIVVAMGGSASICLYPMSGADAKRSMVRGTLSLALGLGRTIREARRSSNDPFASMLSYLKTTPYYQHCRVLFEGKTVDLTRRTTGGFALGNVVIEGAGSCASRRCTLTFQNEHLVAREGTRVLAIVPDLIAVLDSATAEPITTEGLKYGQRVTVVGISAAPIMRSPQALAVFGPQAFGLQDRFVPVEEISSASVPRTD